MLKKEALKTHPTLLSGIQPSGVLHLGNYLGAIRNWIALQDKYRSFFMVADYHAITVPQDPKALKESIFNVAALYLAAGVDPQKSVIFVQSHVSAHTELAWILNTLTPMGELERMTQFKDKSKTHGESTGVGLFDYPVLMAADVLLYKASAVPVGEDQLQHIELMRTLARKFNTKFGKLFIEPKAALPDLGARVMGLDDPERKMSKSAASALNYIALDDEPAVIRDKFKKAVTDSGREVKFNMETKPAISNLLTIYSLVSEKSIKELEQRYAGRGYVEFKSDLAEAVVEFLAPIQKRLHELKKDRALVESILEDGARAANEVASATLAQAKQMIGLG